jgi:hypothetical protein
VKTQGSLPSEDAVLALPFGFMATGQIVFRKLASWQDMAMARSAAPRRMRKRRLNPDAAGIAIALQPTEKIRHLPFSPAFGTPPPPPLTTS